MSFRNNLAVVVFMLLLSCKQGKEKQAFPQEDNYAASEYLIEAEELLKILGKDPNLAIIDFRKPEEYAKGHIGGALNIWRTDIEDASFPYRGMMAKKEAVEDLLGGLGIKNKNFLVVYDDSGSTNSARLWWGLKNYNYKAVRILNGGISAWTAIGGDLSTETKSTTPSAFTIPSQYPSTLLIGKEELHDMIVSKREELVVVDTRTVDEYSGKRKKGGAAKAGRIPNSIHIDWAEAIDYEGSKKFKTLPELQKIYDRMEAAVDDPIIVYCHTGVRSSHTTFVLTELLGYTNVRNYDGSWTEWSHFDNLPFEKDSITVVNK